MSRRAVGWFLGLGLFASTSGVLAQLPPSLFSASQSAPTAAIPAASDVDRMLADLGARETALRQELDALGPELTMVQTRTLARGRAYYRLVRAGLLPVGGGFDSLVDHAAKVERTRKALERDVAKEKAIVKRQADLSEKLNRLGSERAPLELQREAMQRARAVIAEAEERQRAFDRAFASSSRPTDYVAVYGAESGPTNVDPTMGFGSLRGRLPLPVTGRAEVRRVEYMGGPGIELEASAGATARSVSAGRVVFADRNEGYGLVVILDHGDNYFSVYGHLGATDAVVGATIAAGGRVGVLSSEGGRGMLYFELRKAGSAIDPGPWLGL